MRFFLLIALTVLINACSSPKPPMVDGKHRIPVNNQPVTDNTQNSVTIF